VRASGEGRKVGEEVEAMEFFFPLNKIAGEFANNFAASRPHSNF
jgi:hypothetical protein